MTLVIAVVIGSIVGFKLSREFGWDDYLEGVLSLFLGLILGGLLALVVFIVGTSIANISLDHRDEYQRVDLVSIKDGSALSGAFVLGTGGIGTTGKYSFYYRDGGALTLTSVDSTNIKLYEDSDKAYAVRFVGCSLSPYWVAPCFANGSPFVEIHVPAGSVKTKIDLGNN